MSEGSRRVEGRVVFDLFVMFIVDLFWFDFDLFSVIKDIVGNVFLLFDLSLICDSLGFYIYI